MKKIIALILAALMLLTFVSCGQDPQKDDSITTEAPAPSQDETTTASLESIATALINKYAEYANLRGQYDDYMASLGEDASEEDKMTYETFASYQLVVQPVEKDAEWLMGLTEIPTGYSECYNYIPSSMNPFMGYVFRLEEGTDVEAFKKSLTDNCDLRWMICREANTIICENYGDVVLFQMCVVVNEDFPDGFTVEQKQGFIDTFNEVVKAPVAE